MGKIRKAIGEALIKFFWKYNFKLLPMYNEKIGEYPFALTRLRLKREYKILDCGCNDNLIVPFLCTLGYNVRGIDIELGSDISFANRYPNYRFIKCDIRKILFEDNFFDVVTCLSTLEFMLDETSSNTNDYLALKEIIRVIKPQGQLILTLPYGKSTISREFKKSPYKSYDANDLDLLLMNETYRNKIKVNEIAYFKKSNNTVWQPADKEDLVNVDNTKRVRGNVCIDLIKI